MLPLLLLPFTLWPLTLVSSSAAQPTQQEKDIKLLDELISSVNACQSQGSSIALEEEIRDIVLWMEGIKHQYYNQVTNQARNSQQINLNETQLPVEKTMEFWSTVQKFLTTIQSLLTQSHDLPFQADMTLTFHSIIKQCLNRVPKEVTAEAKSESLTTNPDVLQSVKLAHVLEGLIFLKNLIQTSISIFLSEKNTFDQLNVFEIQFELLLRAFQPQSEPNFVRLNDFIMNHRPCAVTLKQRIDANLSTLGVSIGSMPINIQTLTREILVWTRELKTLLTHIIAIDETSSSFDLSVIIRQLELSKKKSLKFWVFTHNFLSLVVAQFNGSIIDSQMTQYLHFIDGFKTKINLLTHSPNFPLLEQAQSFFPTTLSEVTNLIEYGQSLNLLSILINETSAQFTHQGPLISYLHRFSSSLKALNSMFENDRISYSNLLKCFWPYLNNIPKNDLYNELEAVKTKIVKVMESKFVIQIKGAIQEIKSIGTRIANALNHYKSEMNDSTPSKFLFINIPCFSLTAFVLRPVDEIMNMFFLWVNSPWFALEHPSIELKQLQEKMQTLKAATENHFNSVNSFCELYEFRQVVKILSLVVDMIEIKVYLDTFKTSSEIIVSMKLENCIDSLVEMVLIL